MKVLSLLCLVSAAVLAGSPPVTTAPPSYDFGSVKQGETVRRVFSLKNSGSEPVRIQRVEFQLPGMKARFRPLLPGGGEGSVEIEWATGHLAGPIETEAYVAIDGAESVRIPLKIQVTPPLEIRPLSQVFLSAFVGEDVSRVLTIENHEEGPVALAVEGGAGRVDARLATVAEGRTFELTVRSAAGVKPGRYEEVLTLTARGARPLTARIPVHLFIKPDLYANPGEVDFGRVPAGPERSRLVETFLVKRRAGSFHITSISCAEPGVKLDVSPRGPSDNFRVDVRLSPDARGPVKTEIRIGTDDPRFPSIVVPVHADSS